MYTDNDEPVENFLTAQQQRLCDVLVGATKSKDKKRGSLAVGRCGWYYYLIDGWMDDRAGAGSEHKSPCFGLDLVFYFGRLHDKASDVISLQYVL